MKYLKKSQSVTGYKYTQPKRISHTIDSENGNQFETKLVILKISYTISTSIRPLKSRLRIPTLQISRVHRTHAVFCPLA